MLVSDLWDLYLNKPLVERPNFRSVVDYIEAQDKVATETYWRSYLSGVSPVPLALPIYDTLSITTTLSMAGIEKIAKQVGVTVAVVAKLAWAATLRKYTRQKDIVFGQVLSNRNIPVRDADKYV